MSPRQRAERLLAEIREEGWEVEFVVRSLAGRVHVVASDYDHPSYNDLADAVIGRKVRTICGQVVRVHVLDGRRSRYVTGFDDDRLCQSCHDAFPTHEDQALIFDANTDRGPSPILWHMSRNDTIRAWREQAAERLEKQKHG